MSELDQPEQLTLFRIGPDGRLKTRQVWKPTEDMQQRHDEMLKVFHDINIPMPHAYGGVRGKSLRDNIEPHRGNEVYYMLDIKNAYASVDIDHLRDQVDIALRSLRRGVRVRKDVDDFIAGDALIDGVPGLPQGYPASPYLFNLYCREMDGRLHYAFSQLPWGSEQTIAYTRWLDDLTFSGARGSLSHHRRRVIRDIVSEVPGFEAEPRKTKNHTLGKGAVTVTGISLYPDGRMTPSPALLEQTIKVFDAADEMLEFEGSLDEEMLEVINGYNSVLHIAGDPERSGSRLVRTLSDRYRDIARRAFTA